MEKIMDQYGETILKAIIFVALAGIIIFLCTNDGFVATQFQNALTSFFTDMNSLSGGSVTP